MRLLLVALLAACAGPSAETARWPTHRQHHDAELERLDHEITRLETRIVGLEARLHHLEQPSQTNGE